ncbi:putative membrane protein [Emiliania huxleyi virus 18]|nr:putative membrane protein [Emiliania huxleyi virus 18]
MIVAVIILGVVLVGLWMYMRRTKPHTAVDEEARQEAILKRRMESKASRAEVDRLEQIAQGKKDIEELKKPFVGAPMPKYDPSQIEQDPEKRKEKYAMQWVLTVAWTNSRK